MSEESGVDVEADVVVLRGVNDMTGIHADLCCHGDGYNSGHRNQNKKALSAGHIQR